MGSLSSSKLKPISQINKKSASEETSPLRIRNMDKFKDFVMEPMETREEIEGKIKKVKFIQDSLNEKVSGKQLSSKQQKKLRMINKDLRRFKAHLEKMVTDFEEYLEKKDDGTLKFNLPTNALINFTHMNDYYLTMRSESEKVRL